MNSPTQTTKTHRTPAQIMNDLYTTYGLTKDEVYTNDQYKIITRQGIDKIQAGARILINYSTEYISPDAKTIIIKAIGKRDNQSIETYGSAAPYNYTQKKSRAGNDIPYYPVEMAEKRAMSRCVLKLAGLYESGFFGEDESEEYNKENSPKAKSLTKTESAIKAATK